MRYNSIINNVKANEWGLTIQQAYLFSWFYELPSWASKVMIEGDVYYFASKNKAIDELPILTTKSDTMYRYYKQLELLELVIIKKIDGKDYISITTKGKEWNFCQSDNSENNPTSLGFKSENNSDLNPTYNNTNTIINIKDNNKKEKFNFRKELVEFGFKEELILDWLKVRKTKKATNTETALKNFLNEISKRECNLNEILEFIITKSWSGFKWSWYDSENNKEKSSAKKENEPIFAGRQTLSTIKANMDGSTIYNPYLKTKEE